MARRLAIAFVACLALLVVLSGGVLVYLVVQPVTYFRDGVRAEKYIVNSGYYIETKEQFCTAAPLFRVAVTSIKEVQGIPEMRFDMQQPKSITLTLHAGDLIRMPNPCTGTEEVIGKVLSIDMGVYVAENQVVNKNFYSRGPRAMIEFYHSWLTRNYGPVGYENP